MRKYEARWQVAAQWLAHVLDEQEITQCELAKAVHIDRSEVTRWRNGERRLAVMPLLRMLLFLRAKGVIRQPEDVSDWVKWWGYNLPDLIQVWRGQARPGDPQSTSFLEWLESRSHGWRTDPVAQGVDLPAYHVERMAEMAQWRERLKNESGYRTPAVKRLVLWGMAGVGKTVLAQALALDEEMNEYFRNGVLWATLGPGQRRGEKNRSNSGDVVQAFEATG